MRAEDHLGLVWTIALEFKDRWKIRDDLIDSDLISVGYVALVKAEKKYDPAKVKRISSYLAICIKRAMLDYLTYEYPFFYLPRQTRTKCIKLGDRMPDLKETKELLGFEKLTNARYEQIRRAHFLHHAKLLPIAGALATYDPPREFSI